MIDKIRTSSPRETVAAALIIASRVELSNSLVEFFSDLIKEYFHFSWVER